MVRRIFRIKELFPLFWVERTAIVLDADDKILLFPDQADNDLILLPLNKAMYNNVADHFLQTQSGREHSSLIQTVIAEKGGDAVRD